MALSDAAGAIVERVDYDAYGLPTFYGADDNVLAHSSIGNTILFTGREYDAESGTYYYRARSMHPNVGRFMQHDPLMYIDGMNDYYYVGNSPIVFIDAYGYSLTSCDLMNQCSQHPLICGSLCTIMPNMCIGLYAMTKTNEFCSENPLLCESLSDMALGALGIGFGVAEIGGSGVLEVFSGGTATPLAIAGAASGGVSIGLGADQFSKGLHNLAEYRSGGNTKHDSPISNTLQHLGVSQNTSNTIVNVAGLVSMTSSVGSLTGASSKIMNTASKGMGNVVLDPHTAIAINAAKAKSTSSVVKFSNNRNISQTIMRNQRQNPRVYNTRHYRR